jgi:hypothetical protein
MSLLQSNASPETGGGRHAVFASSANEADFTGRSSLNTVTGAYAATWAIEIAGTSAWSVPNKHVVDGAGGENNILATISEFEAAPTASRTRPIGIYSPRYHTLVEATYTNTSAVSQFVDIAIDGGAVKTGGTGTVYLTAEFGTSSVNGTDADGDRIAYMEEVTTSPRRRTGVGSVTLAPSATVYASVAVVIDVSSGTVIATGRDCRVNLIVMPV